MNIKQAYLGMIKAFPGGWDAMAAALGFTRDALENRIYERKGQDLHVQTALQMQSFSGTDLFAEAIATAAGGTFVKLPIVDAVDNEDISVKFHELYAELGELSVEFTEITKKGEIDKRDQQLLNNIVGRMHKTMDELRVLTFNVYCHDTKNKMTAAMVKHV